ncbi:MAG: hypothetical protein US89_C0005G0040 [Candidatus Peregrinibacteria bacterium GW2011_GWF2_38_29]|nr:MAG: hypothetical protein US89_C0005G0040 [Candidatus Peregrinibacteria bacterium GW2011_GWF2_38_29]HBB02627.1 hypothetical protein [Candidatus Peregrinibacteria bacterium]
MTNKPKLGKNKKGFTLIEMIIAIGLVGIVSGLTAQALADIMRTNKYISMNQAVTEDAQLVMNLLATEVQNNAVDYEGYYEGNLHGSVGLVYGEYAGMFEHGDIGGTTALGYGDGATTAYYENKLALISPDGFTKKVYGTELNTGESSGCDTVTGCEYVLSNVQVLGCDSEPKDGIPDRFRRESETCDSINTLTYSGGDWSDPGYPHGGDFYPVSSSRTNITDLRFYITPWNDPYKAYAMEEYVYQPSVTIVMTIKPSKIYFGSAADNFAGVTIQTTATPRLMNEVKSN